MITLLKKTGEYITKKNVSYLLIRVTYFSEGCILIKEPKIGIISEEDVGKYNECERISNERLTLLISKEFRDIFGKKKEFLLDLVGTFKKKIILKNFQPIILRTCKMD